MTGVEIIGLLLNVPPVVAVVPAAQIMGGELPEGSPLPALVANSISIVDDHRIDGSARLTVERVQVTVFALNYAQQKQLIALVRSACGGRVGTIGNVDDVTVRTDGGGPDFRDEDASIWMQTQDFRVSYPA